MKYAIGIDYGTRSGRTVLVELGTGRELAVGVLPYPHGVMDEILPSGKQLPHDWALQHPRDYLDVLAVTLPAVIRDSGVDPADIIGVGIDFTACTMMGVKADGTPLCFLPEWAEEPHAYVKLWKHHAAQGEANRLNQIAARRGEAFLARYGGKVSSEWMFPKIMQVLDEAPEVYAASDRYIEAADWVIWQLTGNETRNACAAGYKALWSRREGYPSEDFFRALDPRLEHVVDEKLSRALLPPGSKAGEVTPEMAAKTGLRPGTAVAVANVDAHVTVPAVGIAGPGKMLMIMGTSICHILVGDRERIVPGMCGVVEGGVLPGLPGYEAGQSCVGDLFAWFVENCLPAAYTEAAAAAGADIHRYLAEKAAALKVGQSGLMALDWWNGNRSVLSDADLTGLMLGMTLLTRPEEIYRALIEATAYGTRMIIENFVENGVPVDGLYAAGGIARKNPLLMQIYADVTGREIRVAASSQAPAVGAAMHAAVAAGAAAGGYDTILQAVREMGRAPDAVYTPVPEDQATYEALYREYKLLHDAFGRGADNVMKRLKSIREKALS